MTEGGTPLRFFLGANSPRGFVSRFDQLERQKDGWNTYIIKGGPGTGKSTLMKNIAGAFAGDELVEEIYCSSDCSSLDGVILHGKRASFADGTPPHTLEPRCPGAYDTTIHLGDYWNEDLLRAHRREIMDLTCRISSLHAQSTRFLSAFAALSGDNARIALEHTDIQKIHDYARRFAARELRGKAQDAPGHEDIRFISAVCDRGVVVHEDTALALAGRIFVIDDPWGAASRLLLEEVRRLAGGRGYDMIVCYCPTDPDGKLEHLFIPSLSLGLMTSNRVHPLSVDPYRVIHARRFTDMEAMRLKKQRMTFNRRAAGEMLNEAAGCIASAKKLHDALESYYIDAMDFDALEEKRSQILSRLQKPESDAARREKGENADSI